MSRGFAILIMSVACLPALAAPDETPLRRSIALILDLQRQDKMSDARSACGAALPGAGNPAAAATEQATLFTTCGNLSLRAGEFAKGRTLLESALALWLEIFGPTHCQVAATTLDLAMAHRLAGRYELSEQHARRALGIYETSCEPQSLTLHQTLVALSTAEIMLGRYAEAESDLNRALSVLGPAPVRDGPAAAAVFSGLGLLYLRQGRYFDAERSYQRATAIQGSGLNFARNLASLANVYAATGRYDKADAACSKALPLLTGFLGPDHAEVAATLQILARARRGQQRYADAADLLQKALDIALLAPDPDRLNESIVLTNIGVSYAMEQRYAEAEGPLRRAISIQEKLGSDARRDYSVTLHNLALACDKQGRHSEALQLASRALAVREADLPGMDASLLEIMLQKAELLRRVHRKTEAAQLERVVRQARAGRSNEDPRQWTVDFRELQTKK